MSQNYFKSALSKWKRHKKIDDPSNSVATGMYKITTDILVVTGTELYRLP